MRCLADQRYLSGRELRKAGPSAIELLGDWHEAGWLHQAAPQAPDAKNAV